MSARPRFYGSKVGRWDAQPGTGLRTAFIDFPAVSVRIKVEPAISEGCDYAQVQAEVDSTAEAIATALHSVSALNDAADSATERARKASERADLYAKRLAAVFGKRRGLNGPAMVRPEKDFTGPVWLLDPKKQFNGFGIRFTGLTDLWIEWPDLRPINSGSDEQGPWMLVDQFAMPGCAR